MRIEIAREVDLPRIMDIEHTTITPAWTEGAMLAEIGRVDTFFPLAVERGKILGFSILRRISDEGELMQMAVSPDARRRGTGNLLMRAILGCARESGLDRVFLEVRKSNSAAIALYEKHGFAALGKRKNYYVLPVEDALVMSCNTKSGGISDDNTLG